MTKMEMKILIKHYAAIIVQHDSDDESLGLQLRRMVQLHDMIVKKQKEETGA